MKNIKRLENEELYESIKNSHTNNMLISTKEENKLHIYPMFSVKELIDFGYLSVDTGRTNEGYLVRTTQAFPFKIKQISDFVDVFINKTPYDSEDTSGKVYIFHLNNSSHLTEKQQKDVLDLFKNNKITREISQLKFNNYNLPNYDFVINQDISSYGPYWQYSHEMFRGSTLNSVYMNLVGNISSSYQLFKWTNKINSIEFNKIIDPYNNVGYMYEGLTVNTIARNCIYYFLSAFSSMILKTDEITNLMGIETEEKRISDTRNVIKVENSVVQRLYNGISHVVYFGRVLDFKTNNSWNLSFPNCTNIRCKNLSRHDFDLSTYMPSMDIDSIKYCIENLYDLKTAYVEYHGNNDFNLADDYYENCITSSTSTLVWKNTGRYIDGSYKIKVPSGLTCRIYYRNSTDWKMNPDHFETIVGDGSYTEITSPDSKWNLIHIFFNKTDDYDGEFKPEEMLNYDKVELYIGTTDSDGNVTYGGDANLVFNHTVTFSDLYQTDILDKSIITYEMIQNANNKGWTIYSGDVEITASE